MAIPQLKRASDGRLLSDKSVSWTGWIPTFNMPNLQTITGVPYEQPFGVKFDKCTVLMRFSDDFTGDGNKRGDFNEIVRCARKKLDLTYRDVYGDTNTVRVMEIGEITYHNEARSRNIFEVEITLRKKAYTA